MRSTRYTIRWVSKTAPNMRKTMTANTPRSATNDALGLVETKGLIATIAATDAMCKAANVSFAGQVQAGGAYVDHAGARRRRLGAGRRRCRGRRRQPARRTGQRSRHSAAVGKRLEGVFEVIAHGLASLPRQRGESDRRTRPADAGARSASSWINENPGRQPGQHELQVSSVRHDRREGAGARRRRTHRLRSGPLLRRGCRRQGGIDPGREGSRGGRAAVPAAIGGQEMPERSAQSWPPSASRRCTPRE